MSRFKILLAEDDRNLGMIIKAFLDSKGHATTLCIKVKTHGTLSASILSTFAFLTFLCL